MDQGSWQLNWRDDGTDYLKDRLEELMELDPTITNDQDDNERPARYLKCQPGSKSEQVNGFVNMVMTAELGTRDDQ